MPPIACFLVGHDLPVLAVDDDLVPQNFKLEPARPVHIEGYGLGIGVVPDRCSDRYPRLLCAVQSSPDIVERHDLYSDVEYLFRHRQVRRGQRVEPSGARMEEDDLRAVSTRTDSVGIPIGGLM